ncbi:MAG: peptidoglycan-associated lipoprotein Pal [Gemmatimonadota bacterium]
MHRSPGITAVLVLLAALACGGNPQPETSPEPDTGEDTEARDEARRDSVARAEAERDEEAEELCQRALAAVTAGNYEEARELYQRARSEYEGTECADRAGDELERLDAVKTVRERIHFEFDESDITDEAAERLQRKARVLRDNPDLRVVIEGHCDERGSNEYNMALGQRRAESARSFLLDAGVPEEVIVRTVSYGEERPLVDRSTEEAWSRNRRAEFVIQELGDL